MWILGHEPAPDHSTIARFQNEKLVPVMEDLFYQLIEQLIDMNEVSYTNVFVDGTKMEANANKYSFVWAKAVEKNLKKLETKTEALTRQTALKYCLREDLSFEELLAEMMREKTVLMVTHRLRGLSRFQQIIVMDNGQIIEQGTHAELLARQGRYYQFKQGL